MSNKEHAKHYKTLATSNYQNTQRKPINKHKQKRTQTTQQNNTNKQQATNKHTQQNNTKRTPITKNKKRKKTN